MAKLQDSHIFSGMQRDVSVSKHPAQFLYDGLNVRLTAREGDTLLSITNEKGTLDAEVSISGSYLGHCMLNQYLVIFSHAETKDYIYRIDLSKEYPARVVLYGNAEGHSSLGFSAYIDAIASYESKTIQKVYWTDGINQPRVINIAPEYDGEIESYNSTSFDFIPTLKLEEEVVVQKLLGTTGEFAPGVIQYAFTYYKKYGQESNIFCTTPLYYISHLDRGGSPEDKISNAFKITITGVDENFDFLRIYSIHRTSINATPICKRVQDMNISEMSAREGKKFTTYTDTGTNGDSVDPTELLYKGGEKISAFTIEQKDSTLFLGGITIGRESLSDIQFTVDAISESAKQSWFDRNALRNIYMRGGHSSSYAYANQLTAYTSNLFTESTPCSGFKKGNTYRCGIQFQHVTGQWSEPIFIADVKVNGQCTFESNTAYTKVGLPCIKVIVPTNIIDKAYSKDYRRIRPVVVFPDMQDRDVVCQGVIAPTVYTDNHDNDNNPKRQSSWFFRTYKSDDMLAENMTVAPAGYAFGEAPILQYCERNIDATNPTTGTAYNPIHIREVEIQGTYKEDNKFKVGIDTVSFHSPDVTFNDQLAVTDFSGMAGRKVGHVNFIKTLSDINIQTETPTVSNMGSGFVHKTFNTEGPYGIGAGLYYDDGVVDDNVLDSGEVKAYPYFKQPCKWLIYPWQGTGSLNNDINRPADKGTATAKLKKKVISNLRYTETFWDNDFNVNTANIKLFSSDEVEIIKLADALYQGNVDTSIIPDYSDGVYLAMEGLIASGSHEVDGHYEADNPQFIDKETPFESTHWLKTWSMSADEANQNGLRLWINNNWAWLGDDIAETFVDLAMKKLPVRMKYKSTAHLVFNVGKEAFTTEENTLPIVELTQKVDNTLRFGGTSRDARMANIWIPCGKAETITKGSSCSIEYSYGDTYFQRYDCLKTYPFTREDLNQIVEIGSFMLESYVNIDGRYDRNRGQMNNLNMSPQNFNLINPVYSQVDNFFTYRILDNDYYTNRVFPNQITWTKEKQSGADIDLWTNITLASTYDMDGSKGGVVSLNTWKDNIYCFQNKGVSNILFNSRVQIPVSDGVPIEISNNYKVDGYKYLSDGIGCNDKWLIKETSSGIYFVDSVGSHLLHIGDGGLQDLSEKCNMTTWFKDNAGSIVKTVFDDINHDVYLVQGAGGKALCFSEKLGQFTGFYDYDNINLIETYNNHVFTMKDRSLWRMFDGEYCNFFGINKPWYLTFISNGGDKMTLDKIFTNLEFRACVEGEGSNGSSSEINVFDSTFDFTFHSSGEVPPSTKYTPYIPVDYLETWNEYQHGKANLDVRNGHTAYQHHQGEDASLKRKFRIWRCDIPRDNYPLTNGKDIDSVKGIYRYYHKPLDRMRNPWLFVKLQKNGAAEGEYLHKTELHDLLVTYFG